MIKKQVLILTRILQVFIFKMYKVGLLTHPACYAFPAFASGKECNKPNSEWSRDTQQQVLFRIRTGIPFSPFGRQRGFEAPCALQMYVLILIRPKDFEIYFERFSVISLI